MKSDNERYIQVSKVAKKLDCSREFVYSLIRDRRLRAVNLGERSTRISVESLNEFIKNNEIDPEKYFE